MQQHNIGALDVIGRARERYDAAKKQQALRQQKQRPIPLWWLGQRDPIARFTAWLAVLTGLLVVATIISAVVLLCTELTLQKTLRETAKSADAAKKSANVAELAWVSTQRAFVVYKGAAVHRVVDDRGQTVARRINVTWENSGNTPTRNMISQIRYDAFIGSMPDDYSFADGDVEFRRTFIAPKSTIEMADLDVPIASVRAAKAGQIKLYIWGWADYDDIFENTPRHRTEFCAEVSVLDPDAQDRSVQLTGCKKHNGADSETFKQPRPYPAR